MNDELTAPYYEHIQGRRHYECGFGGDHGGLCPSVKDDKFNYRQKGPAGNPFIYKKSMQRGAMYDPAEDEYVKGKDTKWIKNHTCEYAKEAVQALQHPRTLTNFWYFLLAPHFFEDAPLNMNPKRDLLIIDEAHNLPEVLRQNASIGITQQQISDILDDIGILGHSSITVPSPNTPESEVVDWLQNEFKPFFEKIEESLDDMEERTEEQQSILEDAQTQVKKAKEILAVADGGDNIVVDVKMYRNQERSFSASKDGIQIKPVDVDRTFKRLVASKAKRILFSSATMFSFKIRECGVRDRDTGVVRMDHNIPVERRMANYMPRGKMTRKHEDNSLPKVGAAVNQIMKKHAGEKGIVHTNSFSRARKLQEYLSGGQKERVIAYEHGDEQGEERKKEFFDNDSDAVFITPAHTTGIDLKEDMARFNVITKIPFPNASDGKVWSKRLDRGEWDSYYSTAFMELVQASGRTTRSTDDYSTTYILDESYGDLRQKVHRELQNHWFFNQVTHVKYDNWRRNGKEGAKQQFNERR